LNNEERGWEFSENTIGVVTGELETTESPALSVTQALK